VGKKRVCNLKGKTLSLRKRKEGRSTGLFYEPGDKQKKEETCGLDYWSGPYDETYERSYESLSKKTKREAQLRHVQTKTGAKKRQGVTLNVLARRKK